MTRRQLSELLSVDDPAWPTVKEWLANATSSVEVLAPSDERARVLEAVQVTLHSSLGAITYETGGLLVDHGWLRILGSGNPRLPRSILSWNQGRTIQSENQPPSFLLVADDIAGGFYAIDGGGLGQKAGQVCYFAPDSLRWESLNKGYTDFLNWTLFGDLAAYYESMRWPGWEQEASAVGGDQALSIYPFLWSKEGKDVARCSRRPVPVSEVYNLNVIESPRQLGSPS